MRDRAGGRLPQAQTGEQGGGALELDARAAAGPRRFDRHAGLAEGALAGGATAGRRRALGLRLASVARVGVEQDAGGVGSVPGGRQIEPSVDADHVGDAGREDDQHDEGDRDHRPGHRRTAAAEHRQRSAHDEDDQPAFAAEGAQEPEEDDHAGGDPQHSPAAERGRKQIDRAGEAQAQRRRLRADERSVVLQEDETGRVAEHRGFGDEVEADAAAVDAQRPDQRQHEPAEDDHGPGDGDGSDDLSHQVPAVGQRGYDQKRDAERNGAAEDIGRARPALGRAQSRHAHPGDISEQQPEKCGRQGADARDEPRPLSSTRDEQRSDHGDCWDVAAAVGNDRAVGEQCGGDQRQDECVALRRFDEPAGRQGQDHAEDPDLGVHHRRKSGEDDERRDEGRDAERDQRRLPGCRCWIRTVDGRDRMTCGRHRQRIATGPQALI